MAAAKLTSFLMLTSLLASKRILSMPVVHKTTHVSEMIDEEEEENDDAED